MPNEPQFATEEDVKIKFLVPYLRERGYDEKCIDYEVAIEVHEGRKRKKIFADAVVYSSAKRKAPVLLCETKHPNEPLSKAVREQAISYARLLDSIAPLVLITNGSQTQVFHVVSKTRLPELPARADLDKDILKFVLSNEQQDALRREAKHELFIIDDVKTFKSILRSCHNEIRNNEGLDPTAAFDEMSKVMFCKLYEEKENPKGNRFRASVFDDSLDRLHFNVVQKILDEAKEKPGYSEIFDSDARIGLKDRTVRKLVGLLESYDLGLTAFDVKGEAFEFFLGETFTGGLGEYFTPRNIVEFMVEAMDPKIGEKIIDPFCGTGGFLIYAFETISEKIRLNEFSKQEKERWRLELSNRSLFGTDWKERTSQACKMNMMVHGDGSSGVFKHDGFLDISGRVEEGAFDLCLTNPPFGSIETDPETLNRFELGSGRNSSDRVILALERCLRLVKPGGRVAIVVIDGVLNNRSTRYVRDYVKRHAWVRGIISLNKETFEGYGSRAKTSILFLERKEQPDGGEQQSTFMAIAHNTGLAPNGDQIPGNELPDILMDYRAFLRGEKELEQHKASWVGNVDDRLDAEYYAEPGALVDVDVGSVRTEISRRIKESESVVRELTDSQDLMTSFETTTVQVGNLLEEKKVRKQLDPDEDYQLVGVKWWGEGAFIREQKRGGEIKAKSLYEVRSGWLIYNRLFAYRAAFAILEDEHDGCFVSSEFPTFDAKEGIAQPDLVKRFIVHCMNSPLYIGMIDARSTGSTKTSRNRFNQKQFLALEIAFPKNEKDLIAAVEMLDKADALKRQQDQLAELAKSLREGVLGMIPMPKEDDGDDRLKPLSMHPLEPEEALSAFMDVDRDKVLEAEKREKKGK